MLRNFQVYSSIKCKIQCFNMQVRKNARTLRREYSGTLLNCGAALTRAVVE
jgi:hypothetical protein